MVKLSSYAKNSPKIIIHFIAHVQLNSREDEEREGKKIELCLYLG